MEKEDGFYITEERTYEKLRPLLEQQYVDSYKYTSGQKLFGCLATLITLLIIIGGGTLLAVSIINIVTK